MLVQVNELILPADFYIIDMEDSLSDSTPLLLGRPFMRTARTKIDVFEGKLTMEFDGEIINFNIFDSMRYPLADNNHCFSVDIIDSLAQEHLESIKEDKLEVALTQGVGYDEQGESIS